MDLNDFQNSFAKLWGYTNAERIGTDRLEDGGVIMLVSGAPARILGQVGVAPVAWVNSMVTASAIFSSGAKAEGRMALPGRGAQAIRSRLAITDAD